MPQKPKILFVSHDANRAGAQLFLLNIMQYFGNNGYDLHILLLANGILFEEFKKISEVYLYPDLTEKQEKKTVKILKKLKLKSEKINDFDLFWDEISSKNFDLIYLNTIACCSKIYEITKNIKAPIITHIHEMEYSISLYSEPENRKFLFQKSEIIIACSQSVADNLHENHAILPHKIEIIHSFIDNEKILERIRKTDKNAIRKKYNLPNNKILIGGCGNAEWRKGVDLLSYLVAKFIFAEETNYHFIWVGIDKRTEFYRNLIFDIKKLGVEKHITFIESTPESVEILATIDIFMLLSREDPFPLVMLEAALAEKIIIGYKNSGGVEELVSNEAGLLTGYGNLVEFFHKIIAIRENEEYGALLAKNAKEKVMNVYNFENSIKKIEKILLNYPKNKF